MALSDDFKAASDKVKTLSRKPSDEELLKLYSLFKQGSKGDCDQSAPSRINFIARSKWEGWNAMKGISQDDAMQQYVNLVEDLFSKQG